MKTSRLICTTVIFSAFFSLAASGVGCGDDPVLPDTGVGGSAGGEGGAGGAGGEDGGCVNDSECASGEVCEQGTCIPQNCVNGESDADETDVDCGGSCLPCENGSACNEPGDCESAFCDSGSAGGSGGGGGEPTGPGTCAACSEHIDCAAAEGTYCDAGSCVAVLEVGESCQDNEQCASGFCPADDGVCCDTNCNSTCEACTADKTGGEDGVCGPVTAGEDPDTECTDEGEASCGASGMGCNGDAAAPGCVLYPAATECAAAACIGSELSPSWSCDGGGTCVADSPTSCAPYACNDAGTDCQTSCTDHDDCDANSYCNTSNGTCVPKKTNGDGCTEGAECASGACPAQDLVCCDMTCDGTCESCLAAKNGGANGACGPVSAGTDPDQECPTLQACNGSGMCSL